jgi:crotonobetainyl-CoA:carnitine CoA-transferase CaiB-like acyl-CoA transferase
MGADVIKIERPEGGDDTRTWGPPFLKGPAGEDSHEAAYYLSANRNKRSVAVDIASAEGQATILELVKRADVVIENFKVGQLKRYGLDYESLKAVKPDLIYCSITGFGQTGPWAQRAGYDFIVQGIGGFMSVTGERDDLPGGGPQKAGVAVSDLFSGLYAANAIISALFYKQRTGLGQAIDVALLDVMVATMANMNSNYLISNKVPGRAGNAHSNIVPYQVFACADGHIILAVGNDGQFQRFCAAAGCPELCEDARFATNPQRVRHRDTLVPLLNVILKTRNKADWIERLEAATVPCGPINGIDEVFDNEQVKARGLAISMQHPLSGELPLVANPLKMSVTPPTYRRPPPMLGQHQEEVLASLASSTMAPHVE